MRILLGMEKGGERAEAADFFPQKRIWEGNTFRQDFADEQNFVQRPLLEDASVRGAWVPRRANEVAGTSAFPSTTWKRDKVVANVAPLREIFITQRRNERDGLKTRGSVSR
jgi:hypothetical protein